MAARFPDRPKRDELKGETEVGAEPRPTTRGLFPAVARAGVLSSHDFLVLLTGDGTGYASAGGVLLTNGSGDPLEDSGGISYYVRDVESGAYWSIGRRPVGGRADAYAVEGEPGTLAIRRRDGEIESRMEVSVPPESTLEIRRITLVNHGPLPRILELTSYAEVVLDSAAAFTAHPAFSRLFVQTEILPGREALLAVRRPRAASESHLLMLHALAGEGEWTFETDRARFLGRGGSPALPQALRSTRPLSGAIGPVLDPVLSIRRTVRLASGKEGRFLSLLGSARARAAAEETVEQWSRPGAAEEGFREARRHARSGTLRLGLSPEEAEAFQSLAGAILSRDPSLRPPASGATLRAPKNPADLALLGLRPDLPLALLDARAEVDPALRRGFLKASAYWRDLGLPIQSAVLLRGTPARRSGGTPDEESGAVFLPAEGLDDALLDLLLAAARGVFRSPPVSPMSSRVPTEPARVPAPPLGPVPPAPPGRSPAPDPPLAPDLLFFNGHGGFSADRTEYVIRLRRSGAGDPELPPLPWINVIANEKIGFLASETGAGCTWSGNSREHRLTPWANDPVRDPHGEALYLRDEETGLFWSPLPGPSPAPAEYEVRHGFGYTSCVHESNGLRQETCMFVAVRDPVKVSRVRISNRTDRVRRLSVISYRRLVLGALPETTRPFVVTNVDPEIGAVFAESRLAGPFASRVVFAATAARGGPFPLHVSCERSSFLGRDGGPRRPEALLRAGRIDGPSGAGLDPCIAEERELEIPPNGTIECAFLFGETNDRAEARELIARYRREGALEEAFREVGAHWRRIRSGLRIETPVPAIDLMVNGWLLYQTIACRLDGRSALYQSGGAYGFRDQLQDASALVYALPERAKSQILLHAAHQFVEGDVLHWWHPPDGRGIRTRFSDDLLWLPFLTAFYVRTTGDRAILEEKVRFLEARPLADGEDEAFLEPRVSGRSADLYEHCRLAIDRSLATGRHGLPLFGTGDWNDGMNRVGRGGKGESVWMGFFLYSVLEAFLPFCEERGDAPRVERYRAARERLREALNEAGWDGDWYRRGFYDDGTPLGSSSSDECRIDALAQAWSVISGAAPPERAARALDAVEKYLISDEDGLIRLLTPPFDKTPRDPGYIKGYVPGVRENGGQYTHAALWVVRAFAEVGRRDRAAALLEMLSPVSHGDSPGAIERYRVEPYVVAADVYGEPPHVGRGGWTWYTGSAAWMYRVAIESILGFRLEGGSAVCMQPRIPDGWKRFSIRYRLPGGETEYLIEVENPRGAARSVVEAEVDGAGARIEGGAARFPLVRDGKRHHVRITLG
jgi:cyclic beta-1,2-glucan synthetase